MSVAIPPGGRTVPGGITPPGGEAPPGGRGAPGDKSAPTAPLGRPPRITLRPLKRRGRTTKTVQKIKPSPPTPAQRVRNVLNAQQQRQQHQQQMHAHLQQRMPHVQQANQPGPGPQVPPQKAGMGAKGQAQRAAVNAKVRARRAQMKAQKAQNPPAQNPPPNQKQQAVQQKRAGQFNNMVQNAQQGGIVQGHASPLTNAKAELAAARSGLAQEQGSNNPDPTIVKAYQDDIVRLEAQIHALGGTP